MKMEQVLQDTFGSQFSFKAMGGSTVNVLGQHGNVVRMLFCKQATSASQRRQMQGEAESLKALYVACPELSPKLYAFFDDKNSTIMISDYFPPQSVSSYSLQMLGTLLASKVHQSGSPNGQYGFPVTTHCGPTPQDNTWESDWMVFFRDRRLRHLIMQTDDEEVMALGEKVCEQVCPLLLENFEPKPKPVLLHGDLWSGNASAHRDSNGVIRPFIFDASSYYGHHEADLGIMNMFGGFGPTFFDAYHTILPKSKPYFEERVKLYELYHHVNHYLLFGRGYRLGAIKIMRDLLLFSSRVNGEM